MRIKETVEATKKSIKITVVYNKNILTYRLPLNASGNLIQDITDKLANKLLKTRRG